jgi:hypothetical protein
MEQNAARLACTSSKWNEPTSQVLMVDGYKVTINYLSSRNGDANNNVLHDIHKVLLTSYHSK